MELNIFIIIAVTLFSSSFAKFEEMDRPKCENRYKSVIIPHSEFRHRLNALRAEMKTLDAYIVTSYDEHQNKEVADYDHRRKFISGFSGTFGDIVVTKKQSALWTNNRYRVQADAQLDCEWKIFIVDEFKHPTIPEWINSVLIWGSVVGIDPYTIPHYVWQEWTNKLTNYTMIASIDEQNLVDIIWKTDRPSLPTHNIKIHSILYSGERWMTKIAKVRNFIASMDCQAIIITSLSEIAYTLNLRGKDIPYVPVFKAYLVIDTHTAILYTSMGKITEDVKLHLRTNPCNNCVQIKDYDFFISDILNNTEYWEKVFLPGPFSYDTGVSEAVHSLIKPKSKIVDGISPILFMKAEKNDIQREGMISAHIRDGAAMVDFLYYCQYRYEEGDTWTELSAAMFLDRARRSQKLSAGLSLRTIIGSGAHGSMYFYFSSNSTNTTMTDNSTIIIESGGQYLDGTTVVSRTIHLGTPTSEQKKAYTNVLSSLIRLSMLVFPEQMDAAEIDSFVRGPLWETHNDYPHDTGHGIGSYLTVNESPINIAHKNKEKYTFKDGYFFSNGPGFYKRGSFGVKLQNVLEVIDTGKSHHSGSKFLSFQDRTLVPFNSKLIDRNFLNGKEKHWLNVYNGRIRDLIGPELTRQGKMKAYYWMLNNTVIEYIPESEYNENNSNKIKMYPILITVFVIISIIYN